MFGQPNLSVVVCASLLLLHWPLGEAAKAISSDQSNQRLEVQDKEANQTEETAAVAGSSQGGPAEQVPSYMHHMTIILVCLHLSVFISGLVGNSLVCLSVLRNKSLQTVTNYYIVNLAVADFLVILICLPPTVYWDLTLTWNFGLILCKLVLYLQSISVSVSVLTLTCISIDRWYAICRPLEFSSTKYRAKITICLIWMLSLLIASPDAIFLTTKQLYEEDDFVYTDCTYSWPESNTKIYQLCIVTLLFVTPFVLMSISYSHIVNVLWRNEMSAIQSDETSPAVYGNMPSTSTAVAAPSSTTTTAILAQDQGILARRKPKRKQKAKKWGGNNNNNNNQDDDTDNGTNNKHRTTVTGSGVSLDRVVVGAPGLWAAEQEKQRQQQPTIVDRQQNRIDLKPTHKQQQQQPGPASEIERTDTSRLPEQERGAGNELRNCLVSGGGSEAGENTEAPALGGHRRSLAPREGSALKRKLIPNQSDSKSSRLQLSGLIGVALAATSPASKGDSADVGGDDHGATKGEPIVEPGCPVAATSVNIQGHHKRAHSAATTSNLEPLKSNERETRRGCCGLLTGPRRGLAEDGIGQSSSKLSMDQPTTAGGAKFTTASIVKDGTTSRKYRRNLANYAAKRAKYRPSSNTSPMATKSVKLMPTASTASQLEHEADSNNNNDGGLTEQCCDPQPQNNSHSKQQPPPNYLSSSSSNNARFYKLIESRKKAAKMLIVIVIMFGLCYLPIHFLNTLRYTIGLPQNDITTIASLVSHWLCYFNSAINPLIYNLMSGKFRKEFANLFFCRCFRRHGPS